MEQTVAHLPPLIVDLGIILMTAAVVTVVFRAIRQPVVLGYLLAGFLIGPHFPWMPTINDPASVQVWAEIGVIFLLFGLGLEFSFRELRRVGKTASITAVFEVAFMGLVGFIAGQALGWSTMDSLFLGGILAISSTTIIVRAFDELGMKGQRFVSLVFGVLIVEDLVAVLLLVLLSTVAVGRAFSGFALVAAGAKLAFFLALWFAVGLYALPTLFKRLRAWLHDETLLIVSLAFCFMMVILATKSGFSPALGAFVMGSLLAETTVGKRVEHLLVHLRDLFAAVFFVSIGMLIDPTILQRHFGVILLLTVLTIAGKVISTTVGALLSGESMKPAAQMGMSLAQIGEFSFIIASLGTSLHVTSAFLAPIAVAISAVTTLTTPYLIQAATPFANWLEQRMPARGPRPAATPSPVASPAPRPSFASSLGALAPKILLNSVLVIAILLATKAALDAMSTPNDIEPWMRVTAAGAALILASPFLWGAVRGNSTSAGTPPLINGMDLGLVAFRLLFGLALLVFNVAQFSGGERDVSIALVALSVLALSLCRFAAPVSEKIERRFLAHLDGPEADAAATPAPKLAPWDAHLAEFTLSPHSSLVAKTLAQSALKENFGVTVVLIERGRRKILAPSRDDLLLPYDRICMVGTDAQLTQARQRIEVEWGEHNGSPEEFRLAAVPLSPRSRYVGKPIRDSELREAIKGLVVGLERGGERILSPDSSLELKAHDVLWVVGDPRRIRAVASAEEAAGSAD